MIIGIGRGFVAYASERAALHVGCVGSHLEARYILKEGDVISVVSGTGTTAAPSYNGPRSPMEPSRH